MTNSEKVSYIKGLAEGLELDTSKKEVKVINAIIDLLDEMSKSVEDVQEDVEDVRDQLDAVDEDLGNIEEDYYGEDEDSSDEEMNDEEYYEVDCPNCGETVCLTEEDLDKGEISCPNCGTPLEFDIDDGCCCNDSDDSDIPEDGEE